MHVGATGLLGRILSVGLRSAFKSAPVIECPSIANKATLPAPSHTVILKYRRCGRLPTPEFHAGKRPCANFLTERITASRVKEGDEDLTGA